MKTTLYMFDEIVNIEDLEVDRALTVLYCFLLI